MIERKILIVEDILELNFMKDLFRRNLNRKEYRLDTLPDLSEERYFIPHLPEGYDVYWLHTTPVEFSAITEIRKKQPWSKIILRNSMRESVYAYNFLKNHKVDFVISKDEGLNEQKVIQILNEVGINISLPREEVD
tara:strand:+ start:62 stop:469 length:408 start_codon:yes stop_codon:yes gene_type:complete